ncbi:MAG: ribonuclease III [Gammaproteobacteria bacterium]|nr:ribonuclease III [Gammaproteobacteria bacterium]
MREPLEHLCRKLGYDFTDKDLIDKALTHRSAGGTNNERMEFLGDSILGFVIADQLFHNQARADEGDMSRLRSSLVRGTTLAELAREIDLGKYLLLGPGELRSGGQSRDSILADALEAIFAAVYLDGGYEAARKIILDLYQVRLDRINTGNPLKDPKTRLQEYLQGQRHNLPNYSVIEVTGEQHDQSFTVKCVVDDLELNAIATGSSRRKAEQMAAEMLLQELSQNV